MAALPLESDYRHLPQQQHNQALREQGVTVATTLTIFPQKTAFGRFMECRTEAANWAHEMWVVMVTYDYPLFPLNSHPIAISFYRTLACRISRAAAIQRTLSNSRLQPTLSQRQTESFHYLQRFLRGIYYTNL
jgi:hypothetical protein